MDQKAIETLAVSSVRNSIVLSDYLDQFIQENDKEPSWDGFVYIYNNKDKKKEHLAGRVPVQVKGHINDDFSKSKISFSVEINDLNNYLLDGGIIYFVVYVTKDGNYTKIYYSKLLPVRLKRLLSESKGQKSRRIEFKEFPIENIEKINVFSNFFADSKKQKQGNIITFNELRTIDSISGISASLTGFGYDENAMFQALLNNEVSLYAKVKGTDTLIPIEEPLSIVAHEEIEEVISSNNKTFYYSFSRIHNSKETIIKIGESFSIIIDRDNPSLMSFSFKLTKKFRKAAVDMDFFINILKSRELKIGEKIDFSFSDENLKNISLNIKEEEKKIEYTKKAITALDLLHIEDDIDISSLKARDFNNIDLLVKAFVENETIIFQSDIPKVFNLGVADLNILLVAEEYENGRYKLYDFFNSNVDVWYKYNTGDCLKTSIYSYLQKNDYLHYSNIDYQKIVLSYKNLSKEIIHAHKMANLNMLLMLNSYDQGGSKKLLDASKGIIEWFSEDENCTIDKNTTLLNYLQIVRRERELTIDEIKQLYSIEMNPSLSDEIKVGACLLAGNQILAESHFEKMNEDIKQTFKTYPIYKFWNKKVDKTNSK